MGNAEGEFPDCWFPSFYFFLLRSPSFLLSLFWLSAFSPRQQLGQRLKNTGSKSIGERNSGVCTTKNKLSWFMSIRVKSSFLLLLLFKGIEGDDSTRKIWKDIRVCKDGISVQEKYHCMTKAGEWKEDVLCTAGMRRHKGRQKIIEGGCKMLQKKVGS
jgi:hypothetical protein